MWAKFGVITVFHCSVIMHCCQKLVSDLGTYFQLCTNKIPIEFALQDEHKHIAFLIWDTVNGEISIYNEEKQNLSNYQC